MHSPKSDHCQAQIRQQAGKMSMESPLPHIQSFDPNSPDSILLCWLNNSICVQVCLYNFATKLTSNLFGSILLS